MPVAPNQPRSSSSNRAASRRTADSAADSAAPLILVVDGVRDPGNLGTLLRSAPGPKNHAKLAHP